MEPYNTFLSDHIERTRTVPLSDPSPQIQITLIARVIAGSR